MATKKLKGLGMGLEALLGPATSNLIEPESTPRALPLSQLRAGQYQPRKQMDEGSLYELAESIRTQGIMQPLLVRPVGPSGYEIIAGERRFRAAQLAGLTEVPVLVKDVSDETAAIMALIENMQREDLNPLEEAQGLQRLVHEFKLTHEQAAQAVGRSRSAATNLMRLLQLAQPVQKMLMAGDIDMGHARALLPLDQAQQILLANEVAARKLSVRQTEQLAARSGMPATTPQIKKVKSQASRDVQRLEQALSDHLATTVRIQQLKGKQSGEIHVTFHSFEALEGLLQRWGIRL